MAEMADDAEPVEEFQKKYPVWWWSSLSARMRQPRLLPKRVRDYREDEWISPNIDPKTGESNVPITATPYSPAAAAPASAAAAAAAHH